MVWIMAGVIIIMLLWILGVEIMRIYDAWEVYEEMEKEMEDKDNEDS